MKIKIFLTALLLAVSLITLSSCKHEHEFKDWKIITPSTCTSDGMRMGTCECGATDEQIISAAHTWEKDIPCGAEQGCTVCNETRINPQKHVAVYPSNNCKFCGQAKIDIVKPELPLTVHWRDYKGNIKESFKVTEVNFSSTSEGIVVSWGGEKVLGLPGGESTIYVISYKLYDAEGYLIESDLAYTPGMREGDKVRGQTFTLKGVSEWEKYVLEIRDVIEKAPGTN